MEITRGYREKYFYLALAGQLWQREDMDELDLQVSLCFKAGRPWIILDLDRISFMNSQALGQLVRIHSQCMGAQGKLILYQPRSNVREVIEVSDFPDFMAVANTEEELDRHIADKNT